jgi:hypothetical protein
MRARPSAFFWLTSRLHARRVVKRLPSKSRRSDAGDCFRRVCSLQAAIHVGGAGAKRLGVLAGRWKDGALHGGARERSAACARSCLQLNELRKAGGGGTRRRAYHAVACSRRFEAALAAE